MNAPALEVQGLHAGYGSIQVLRDISMTVEQGAVTTLLGANGAGKSTTLRAICGLIKSRGTVRFGGDALRSLTPENVARRKVAHIPEAPRGSHRLHGSLVGLLPPTRRATHAAGGQPQWW
jgi:branched-chain amino acid transport system ATP-binding protein